MGAILDGKAIAATIRDGAMRNLEELAKQGLTLKLAVVLVGDNAASATYVRSKERLAQEIGMESTVVRLPHDVSEIELLRVVRELNNDGAVDGILVQLPLPSHIDEAVVIETIAPEKDVDGFHPMSVGRNLTGVPGSVWPCTPAGIMEMLRLKDISVAGKHAVVVGRSNIVGKPMAMLLLQANATVSMCHSHTPNLAAITRQADILVVAVGRPRVISRDHVKPGAVVIDVGMNRVDGKLTGDVDFAAVESVASAITPVPGGVGRLTVAMLMVNTVALGAVRRGVGDLMKQ